MPFTMLDKVLLGAAGVAGAGVVAWQTQFPWIKYDLKLLKIGKRITKKMEEIFSRFLIDKFETHVLQHPRKPMLIFEDNVYTYEFMDQQANRVANVLRDLGFKCGDTVAMMIYNEPAFIWTFLGCQKLGVTAGLINFNLRLHHLSHSILACEPKAIIVGSGSDLLHAVTDILDELEGLPVYVQGLRPDSVPVGVCDFDFLFTHSLPVRVDRSIRCEMTPTSILSYIFTSGTTGLPKPVYISQTKANGIAGVLHLTELSEDDIVYTVLPLYHSGGGGIGLYGVLDVGCTMVLRKKFSASHFWPDCRQYNVTIIQYIGEIFRYVLVQPPHELDGTHKVRAAIGNGLRKDIFEEVLNRFKIPTIWEFFGATEGQGMLINCFNKPGAIGRVSPFLNMIDPFPKVLVKFDYSTAEPLRDKNGCCITIKPGEVGLFLSKVPELYVQSGKFEVYKASKEANEKKFVHNAFKEGDVYFNYGDVFFLDKDYFVYFHDRIGDTFRWKGENVSTTEIANMLTSLDFIHDANVYGVRVPGHDGRAGMAAITLKEGEAITEPKLKEIYTLCEEDLPTYARPLFLRILKGDILTATFKQQKFDLVQQGFDQTKISDPLYYLNKRDQTYSPLTPQDLSTFLQSKL